MAFFIDIVTGPGNSVRYFLSPTPTVVGRSHTCDVPIDDAYVSGRHVEFWEDDSGNCFVRDLNLSLIHI